MNGYYQNKNQPYQRNGQIGIDFPYNNDVNSNLGVPLQNFNNNGIPSPTNKPPTTKTQGNVDYATNIFELNIGREVTVYFSYPDSVEWRDKEFTGTIIESGRDYLLLKTPDNKTVLLWLIYINYAIFNSPSITAYTS